MTRGGVVVIERLGVQLVVGVETVHERHELLVLELSFEVLLLGSPYAAELLAYFGVEAVFGGILHRVVDGAARGFGEVELLGYVVYHLLSLGMRHVAGESFGQLRVGDGDAQCFIFFLEKFFGKESLDDLLCEHVVAVVAALVAQLFAGLSQTVLIVLVLDGCTVGFCHGGGMAEVRTARGEEVAQNECKQCHDDDDEKQH